MDLPKVCRNCGGEDLTWTADVKNVGGCVDGRICMREVRGIFVLGCDVCSETLLIVEADEIAEWLNGKRIVA